MRHPAILFALIAWLASAPTERVEAETTGRDLSDLTLDQLLETKVQSVTAAAKREQAVGDAPSSVSIITSQDIQELGYQTLGEILAGVPGFYVSSDRNYTYLGVRGFNRPGDYNDRVLVLVNGHRVNDDVTGGALIGPEFLLDVDAIDRVEVVRGPGSALYGDNAFFAVINVVSKTGKDINGVQAGFGYGSYGAYKGRFSLGRSFTNGIDLFLSGSILEREGHRTLFYPEYANPPASDGVARNADGEESKSLFAKVTWKDVTLEGGWVDRTKHIPTGSFDTVFDDPRNQTVDGSYYARLSLQHEFADETRITLSASYDTYYYDGAYVYALPVTGTYLLSDQIRGRWFTEEAQVTRTLWDRLTLTAGVELRQNIAQNQDTFSDHPYTVYLDDNRRSAAWGPYSAASFRVLTNLTVEAGVRYDLGDFSGSAVSPRASLIYRPIAPTTFKLLYGQAFRGPNDYERYYTDGYLTQEPNPHLKPETIETYEAVWEQAIGGHWSTSVSGYLYRGKDLINQVVDPSNGLLVYENLSSVRGRGLEVGVSARYPHGLRGRVSWAFQNAEDVDSRQRLSNSPRNLVQGNVIVPLYHEYLFSGLEARYVGGRLSPAGGAAPAYWIANATLFSWRWLNGLEVSATIDNLFDRRYFDPSPLELRQNILEQDGRTFWLKLSYRY